MFGRGNTKTFAEENDISYLGDIPFISKIAADSEVGLISAVHQEPYKSLSLKVLEELRLLQDDSRGPRKK